MLVLSLLFLNASWASWGLWGGSSSLGSPSLAARSFLLAAETPGQVAPGHPSPSAEVETHESLLKDGDPSRGHSSSFCGWAVSLSITGVVFTFASRKRRARVRGAWRRAMNAVARLRYPEPSSPSSYAAALLNPPTLDFLCRSQRWAEDSDDEFKRNVGTAIQKTHSLPAKMAEASGGFSPISDSDEERMSFSTRHHKGPRQRAPTLLQQRQAQTRKGWTAEPSTKSLDLEDELLFSSIPSVQDLRRIYIVQVALAESTQGAVIGAIKQLNELKYGRCKVHFQDGDAKQFYDMLSNYGTKPVSAQSFAVELRQLLSALALCDQLSLPQLRSIMATAFDRFDFNEDGKLSIEEFSSALLSFNIELGAAETETLLRFLALAPAVCEETPVLEKEDLTKADSPELTLEDKLSAAAGGVKDQLQSSTGWNNAVKIAEKVGHCLQQPGSPRSRAQRLMDLGHKELASATEISLTLAGLTMVVLHHSQIHPDAAVLEQMSDALDDFMGAVRDLFQAMPMGPALLSGALGLAKTQKDSVALDVDEALLYARYFLPKGCSQSLFHKLLTMAGCHWGSVSAGQRLQGDGELRILVRGKAIRKRGEDKEDLLPGAFLNARCEDQVVALEDLTYMAWNTEKLNACMESVKDAGLKQLAERMLEDAAGVCHDTQVPACPEEDWFAPVGEALESQAKRRGLVTSSLCPEGFCRILSKPNMSLREKLDQVHAWILSSKDEICDSLEAAGDLAALASLLVALYNHSATLSPENFPQLAPLLILLADVISKKRSSQYDETGHD